MVKRYTGRQRDSPLYDDDSRIVRAEEVPVEFVEEVKDQLALRWSRSPEYVDEDTVDLYLRQLGVSS